ncbi:MAG: FGGY-family carbohydrate kinase [Paracoccaceae bacterium]
MAYILTFDLGGTNFRAGLVDPDGGVHTLATHRGGAGDGARGGEADPEDWWSGLRHLVEEIAERDQHRFAMVEGVAITGFTRTQVLLDADLRPTRPAILFGDTRADAEMDEIRRLAPKSHPETAALNAFHPVARLFWLARKDPAALAAAAAVVEPKDFLNARLTGRIATDRVSSARLVAAGRAHGGGALFGALGLDAALSPQALDPLQVLGPVLPGLPGALGRLAGRPVIAMAHDTWAAVLGLGALRDGRAYNLSGTTDVFGLMTEKPAEAEGLMSVDWGPVHQLGGPSQCGADTLLWALRLVAGDKVGPGDVGAALAAAETAPGAGPLIFLPYLGGERTPWWNPALRGAFVGLSRDHGPGDCLRAVMEGVGFLNRIVLERAEAATGRRAEEIRFGGGGASSPVWAQIKADIFERPVIVAGAAEPGLIGGAMAAWTALGRFATLAEAQERMVVVKRRHEPDALAAGRYRRLRPLFQNAHDALAPISAALGALSIPAPERA